MRKTLKEIASFIGGKIVGEADVVITGVSGIREASSGDITFLANPKYQPFLERTKASAVITTSDIKSCSKPLIHVDNPSLAFAKVIELAGVGGIQHFKGIHSTAIIGKKVSLGKDVAIGPYVVIEEGCVIGDGCVIYAGCFIGQNSRIGSNTLVYPNVSIREGSDIGSRVIIHCGSVIGSDGFGYITIEGRHQKIPQQGIVEIRDDVEIGANVTVDRARFNRTIIGEGTKIDNLVHIAHNVVIGKNCIIVAQVGISGSTTLGDNVILAGQVGLVGHICVGDNVVVMAQSGVSKSIPADTTVWGYPAKPQDQAKQINASVQNLPRLYRKVEGLKKELEELKSQKPLQEKK